VGGPAFPVRGQLPGLLRVPDLRERTQLSSQQTLRTHHPHWEHEQCPTPGLGKKVSADTWTLGWPAQAVSYTSPRSVPPAQRIRGCTSSLNVRGLAYAQGPRGRFAEMGLRDLFRRLVVKSWQTPPSYASTGGGVRVRPGDRCTCGQGAVYQTYSPIYGQFLGCCHCLRRRPRLSSFVGA
jgi:hypothetical protein